jgi:hypothetical protein
VLTISTGKFQFESGDDACTVAHQTHYRTQVCVRGTRRTSINTNDTPYTLLVYRWPLHIRHITKKSVCATHGDHQSTQLISFTNHKWICGRCTSDTLHKHDCVCIRHTAHINQHKWYALQITSAYVIVTYQTRNNWDILRVMSDARHLAWWDTACN